MTDQQMEDLVERIIQRLRPPVLVMVTAAAGYRHAIRQRLAGCGERLHLALDSGIDDGEQWRAIGKTLPAANWQYGLPSAAYKALLLPFLDYPQAADLVNGTLQNPVARRLHDALLAGVPVLALRYHCCPHSELNQLRGAVVNVQTVEVMLHNAGGGVTVSIARAAVNLHQHIKQICQDMPAAHAGVDAAQTFRSPVLICIFL